MEYKYKVNLKNGWRAIIYDAPWAYFKHDQEGLIVTSDGKACETTDDEKDNVIVIADAHLGFEERDNGHILFKQKGSDLFDIVCLQQEPGGTYNLLVTDLLGTSNNIVIDGCSGTWDEFKSKIRVFKEVNGVKTELTVKEYEIVKPTAQYNFKNDDIYDIVDSGAILVSHKVSEKDAITATADLTITGVENEYCEPRKGENGAVSGDINLTSIIANKTQSSEYNYYITKSASYSECTGEPKITFKLDSIQTQHPQYVVNLGDGTTEIKTTIMYDCVKCGVVARSYPEETTTTDNLTFVIGGNVIEISRTANTITLQIEDGVSEFTIKATSTTGITKSAKLKRVSDSKFSFYEYI